MHFLWVAYRGYMLAMARSVPAVVASSCNGALHCPAAQQCEFCCLIKGNRLLKVVSEMLQGVVPTLYPCNVVQ